MGATLHDILSITELLENILLCLDQKTLLTSGQRVCRTWHDLILGSPALQKHLYFQPDWKAKNKAPNPLLVEFFPRWFLPPNADAKSDQAGQGSCSRIQGILGDNDDFETLPIAQPEKNAYFMYEKASWRNMLVQQPPIAELVIFKVVANRVGSRFAGPYVDDAMQSDVSFEDLYAQSNRENEPLKMDCFYDNVILTSGSMPHEWMIVWDNAKGDLDIPEFIDSYKFENGEREMIKRAAKVYGMVLVVSQIKQCCRPYLWTPGEKFIFDKERIKARRGKKKM